MLEKSWQPILGPEFDEPYMQKLRIFLRQEKDNQKTIYPTSAHVFESFNLTPLPKLKVVILGQDPYHGPNQAHGLCFSVQPGVRLPPSLKNIYKELQSDLNIPPSSNGCLVNWAKQGILLLNSVLTVEAGRAASHQGQGWEKFTDKVINVINEGMSGVVFLLWGAYAQRKGQFIHPDRHCVLKAAHPSPFSAYQGFFGCKHFSKTNHYLEKNHQTPIDWRV